MQKKLRKKAIKYISRHSFYKMIYVCHLNHNLELDCTSHSDTSVVRST